MIRWAEEKDIEKMQELLVQVCNVHHQGRPDIFYGDTTKYSKEELSDILQDINRPVFVFADDDDVVLGYAFCIFQEVKGSHLLHDMKTLYIDDLCVDESRRRHHVGESLYEHVLKFAESEGCYNVTLNVWSCNPGAEKFYQKMGLKPMKTYMEKILKEQ